MANGTVDNAALLKALQAIAQQLHAINQNVNQNLQYIHSAIQHLANKK
jgi:hypothetical protein